MKDSSRYRSPVINAVNIFSGGESIMIVPIMTELGNILLLFGISVCPLRDNWVRVKGRERKGFLRSCQHAK